MRRYHYTECGLDNVVIEGLDVPMDDAGQHAITIPNINGLHRSILVALVCKKSGLNGRELRYLRSELGLTQAQFAALLHREPLTLSRWERGESDIDPNAEALARLRAVEALDLKIKASVAEVMGWCVPSAGSAAIVIDGSNPKNYQLKVAA